ncbi:MAG: glycerol acyltransferase [Spirochaetae bacterium HGW-Spirochaetae-5]|nr:MAG: glycerol acyltransferase [Spirochaetae bacterium HGW-Spirochaetae-5]
MRMTIFNMPVIRTLAHWLALFILKILGWKITGKRPEIKKYVMIAAPHTSNWDFFYGLLMNLYFKNEVYWMGKKQIFRMPFGAIMKWFGGLPVDRSRTNNLVQSVIDEFNKTESLIVVVPPEGSRSKVHEWKTGFYFIASGAGVPILLGFLDYHKKEGGYGPLFYTTGDRDNDMIKIKEFYKEIKGKFDN